MSQWLTWECQVCAWVYDEAKGDPEHGIPPQTRWQDVPDDWLCPECGVGKEDFDMLAVSASADEAAPAPTTQPQTSNDNPYLIWECQVCNWVYDESKGDPEHGLALGTRFADIDDDWLCPDCGVGKEDFEVIGQSAGDAPTPEAPAQSVPVAAVQTQIDKSQDPIVILGTGLAGYNLAKALRKLNPTQPISMYTADDGSYYSKPSLSTGFANNKSAQALALKSAEEMAESLEIDIHIHSPIKRIDADNRSIELVSGGRRSYHKLVIAVGANCINAPLQGDGLAQVYQVNTLQDYARFRLVAKHAKRIAIIGGGLIGCEYANDLIQSGYSVDVIDPLAAPIATLLPQAASARVQQALEAAGVNFHFGTVAESVDQVEGGLEVSLANGETLSCDLVLSAIGVRPNLQLAQEAGLKTERGICVDTQLQTSKEHIYAIGDCAQVSGLVLCYIAPLTDQVKALSQILTGQPSQVSYGAMPVQIKTTLHPILVNPPANNAQGEWKVIEDQASGVNLQYLDAQGQLLGFALTGDQVKHGGELRKRSPNLL